MIVVKEYAAFEEYFCDHPLLSEYEGKQRAMGKFLTDSKVAELKIALEDKYTTYDDTTDERFYKYAPEPKKGDFYRCTNDPVSGAILAEDFDEDFLIDIPKDGRKFVCALLLDLVTAYGRKALTGDKTTSTATIVIP